MPEPKNTPGGVDNSARIDDPNAPDIAPKKTIPGERTVADRNRTKQERERDPILAILNNEASTDNETVNYFVDKIKALSLEAKTINEELRSLITAKVAAEKRLGAIEIEANAYMRDAAEWHARPKAPPPEVAEPTP